MKLHKIKGHDAGWMIGLVVTLDITTIEAIINIRQEWV